MNTPQINLERRRDLAPFLNCGEGPHKMIMRASNRPRATVWTPMIYRACPTLWFLKYPGKEGMAALRLNNLQIFLDSVILLLTVKLEKIRKHSNSIIGEKRLFQCLVWSMVRKLYPPQY